MASNYTHFSVTLPIPEEPEKAARVEEWVFAHSDMKDCMMEADDWDIEDFEEAGYSCDFDIPQGEVWVYGDGEGSIESAANLIQRYLDDFEIEGGVHMSFAWTCSKPRINEAGGGAVVVTRNSQFWIFADDEADKLARAAGVTKIY
jgi:hypothetical protein